MNNQIPQQHIHPQYTLPGVMHYLQTQFTKNERDRISWELERSEMKARIAQLEGENKELRYQLNNILNKSNIDLDNITGEGSDIKDLTKEMNDPSPLIKARMAVQENVKEIIYLLKSADLTSQLDSINSREPHLHNLELMNVNTNRRTRRQNGPDEDDNGSPNIEHINNNTSPNNNNNNFDVNTHQEAALNDAMNLHNTRTESDEMSDIQSDAATITADDDPAINNGTNVNDNHQIPNQIHQSQQNDFQDQSLIEQNIAKELVETRKEIEIEDIDKLVKSDHISDEDHDITTTIPNTENGNKTTICKNIDPNKVLPVESIKGYNNQILTLTNDGSLYQINFENNLNEDTIDINKIVKANNNTNDTILEYTLIDVDKILTLDSVGLTLWSTQISSPLSQLPLFKTSDNDDDEYWSDDSSSTKSIIPIYSHQASSIILRNKWMLITSELMTYILNIDVGEVVDRGRAVRIIISKRYKIENNKKIIKAIFGITEKSFIAFHSDPYEIAIYGFNGKIIQTVNVEKHVTSALTESTMSKIELYLNKESSKLLIQLNNLILVYSFDQRKIIIKFKLDQIPQTTVFKSVVDNNNNVREIVLISYYDGTIELRYLKNFKNIIKTFNHYETTSITTPDKFSTMAVELVISANEPFIVSGGQDGKVKVVKVT